MATTVLLRARLIMRGASLTGGDRHAPPAALALLEDRAQPVQRVLVLAPHPAAGAEALEDAVREGGGDRLEREAHARGACRRGRQLVDAERADAVVLARAAHLDDAVGRLDLGERHIRPAEAVAGDLN